MTKNWVEGKGGEACKNQQRFQYFIYLKKKKHLLHLIISDILSIIL